MQTKLLFGLILLWAVAVRAQTTAFTYQGQVTSGGSSANGQFDFQFALRDAATLGNAVGTTQTVASVTVSNGLFTVPLDFGASAFDGSARWLEIGVRPSGGGAFSILSPRQQITSAPYSALALRASTYTGTVQGTNLTGTIPDARLSTNVVLLSTNLTFPGTVNASFFNGNGTGLTNVPGRIFEVIPTAANMTATPNFGYLCTNNSTPVVITLPPSITIGETIRVAASGAGGWVIAQNAGQKILVGELLKNVGVSWRTNGPSASWRGAAVSGDGRVMVAAPNGNQLQVSTNYGSTWTARGSSLAWQAAAASGDGRALVACVNSGQIFNSKDYGTTWAGHNPSGAWSAVASSAGGTNMVATINGGRVYTSSDSGDSWTMRDNMNRNWTGIASSASGTNLAGCVSGSTIFTSSDSGVTWISRNSGSLTWNAIASSSDGSRLIASVTGGQVYISTDYGTNWVSTGPLGVTAWRSVASSADGSRLAAVVDSVGIYISEDSGVNWSLRFAPGAYGWTSIASSSDASSLVAVATVRPIYFSSQTTTTTGTAGALSGARLSAVELEYIGNGEFMPVSYVGTIRAR